MNFDSIILAIFCCLIKHIYCNYVIIFIFVKTHQVPTYSETCLKQNPLGLKKIVQSRQVLDYTGSNCIDISKKELLYQIGLDRFLVYSGMDLTGFSVPLFKTHLSTILKNLSKTNPD